MSTGLLFITAPEADSKLINLLLLQLRDWKYNSGDRFMLVTTRTASDLNQPSAASPLKPTSPPLPTTFQNAWKSAPLSEIESFCLTLNSSGPFNPFLYLLVDSEGARTGTCVLAQRATSSEPEDFRYLDRFEKMRVGWEKAYTVWANFDVGNMGFGELVRELEGGERGFGGEGWFGFRDDLEGMGFEGEGVERRQREIERFRGSGDV